MEIIKKITDAIAKVFSTKASSSSSSEIPTGQASGYYSYAEGSGTIAYGAASHAEGTYNYGFASASITLEHESDLNSIVPGAFKTVYCRDTNSLFLGTDWGTWIKTSAWMGDKLEIVDYEEDTTINNA